MLDNYYESKTEYVPFEKKITVNEHRSPTDDSASLLNELKEKTEKDIFKAFELKDNIVSASAIYRHPDFLERSTYSVYYMLNGKEYKAKGKVDFRLIDPNRPLGSNAAITSLFESLSANLVRELMTKALEDGDLY